MELIRKNISNQKKREKLTGPFPKLTLPIPPGQK
jgi:hypothetical protein